MKTDTLFYRLFKNAPELLLELAKLDTRDSHNYRFCSEEIKQTAFRLDGILTPTEKGSDLPILFAEVQFQPDQHFYSRFFCEIFFYLHQNQPQQAWQAVVIYPTQKTETDGNQHYAALLNSNQVKRIYLEDLVNPEPEKIGLQLIQLIIVEEKNALKTAQNLLNRIKIETDQKTAAYWLEWVETIMVYKLPQLNREEIQKMLGYKDIELKQTRFYQDVFTEGESEIIIRLLKRKLGSLNLEALNKIQILNMEQLEALSDQLLDFTTANDLTVWFKNNL